MAGSAYLVILNAISCAVIVVPILAPKMTHQHNRCSAGALNNTCYNRADTAAHKTVVRYDMQYVAHLIPCNLLKPFRHDLHAEKKHTQATEGLKKNFIAQVVIFDISNS